MLNNIDGLTNSGVAYDLKISPHNCKIFYGSNLCLTYVFSSELYKNKFEQRFKENRDKINNSLSNRFGFTIRNDVLCDIKLYITIEKRGFLIKTSKEGFECLNVLELDGKRLIVRN